MKIDAVLWDFDGTLANSAAKNIAITRQILALVAPQLTGDKLPRCLQNESEYHVAIHSADHWHDLYREFFGLNSKEIEAAGPLWEALQLEDDTEVPLFDGIVDTIAGLSHIPQGVCSANASSNIRRVLNKQGLESAFESVIGYEGLLLHQQKPAPDGGLKCLQDIFGHGHESTYGKTIVYVGDHVADAMFSRGLGERLGSSNEVISVAVTYSGAQPGHWKVQPDEVIDSPAELIDWING